MKKAILLVSFGTSFTETREKNITSIYNDIKKVYPDFMHYEGWTSTMILRKLKGMGTEIDYIAEALERAIADEVTHLYVLPTHLLYGDEYNKMLDCIKAVENEFEKIAVAKPLFANDDDMCELLKILNEQNPTSNDEAFVLIGHGSEHFSNIAYGALDCYAKHLGLDNIFVSTLEAIPTTEMVLKAVQKAGYKKALLTPLMLVAGDHATNDIFSDEEDSCTTIFENAGVEVRKQFKGLGEYEQIRKMYIEHLNAVM